MNKNPIVRKYGLMIGVVACLVSIGGYLSGKENIFGFINFIMIPIGIILACIEYSKTEEYNVNFGQVFSIGFFTGMLVLTIIVSYVILFNLIFPEVKEVTLQSTKEAWAATPAITEQQANQWLSIMDNYYMVITIAAQVTIGLIGSVIASLLGAAFAKKEPKDI